MCVRGSTLRDLTRVISILLESTLEINIKFASTGDRTRVACVTLPKELDSLYADYSEPLQFCSSACSSDSNERK